MSTNIDEEDKKSKQIEQARTGAKNLGVSEWADNEDFHRKDTAPKDFGLCSSCSSFAFVETEFDVPIAHCSSYGICDGFEGTGRKLKLHQTRPILNCTYYERVGALSLHDMYGMAIMIEATNKVKVGFITED